MAFIHLVRQEIINYMNTQIKISTLIITAVSALLFYASFVIGDSENYLFPRLIAGTIAALTLLLYFEKGDPDKSTNFKDLFPGLTIAIAYILLLKIIGFYVGSMILFFALVMIYSKSKESTDFWRVLLIKLGVTIVFTLTLYGLFTLILNVRMPGGLFY